MEKIKTYRFNILFIIIMFGLGIFCLCMFIYNAFYPNKLTGTIMGVFAGIFVSILSIICFTYFTNTFELYEDCIKIKYLFFTMNTIKHKDILAIKGTSNNRLNPCTEIYYNLKGKARSFKNFPYKDQYELFYEIYKRNINIKLDRKIMNNILRLIKTGKIKGVPLDELERSR